MVDSNLLDLLARVAVALPNWRWMDGARAVFRAPIHAAGEELRERVILLDGAPGWLDWYSADSGWEPLPPDALPDFSDPATRGCLLEMVRRHLLDPNAYVEPIGDTGMWAVRCRLAHLPNVPVSIIGGSEVGALVHALGWVNG